MEQLHLLDHWLEVFWWGLPVSFADCTPPPPSAWHHSRCVHGLSPKVPKRLPAVRNLTPSSFWMHCLLNHLAHELRFSALPGRQQLPLLPQKFLWCDFPILTVSIFTVTVQPFPASQLMVSLDVWPVKCRGIADTASTTSSTCRP